MLIRFIIIVLNNIKIQFNYVIGILNINFVNNYNYFKICNNTLILQKRNSLILTLFLLFLLIFNKNKLKIL